MSDKEVLEIAAFASERIKKGSHLLDWFSVGAGFDVGCRLAIEQTGANDKSSKLYQNAFGKWMKEQPWTENIDKATRNHAIWLHENRTAVEEFLTTLDTPKRLKMNHPTVVRRAWDRAHNPKVESDPKPKQVKIDVDELDNLHAELDALKQENEFEGDNEGRIEELERLLEQAHMEIARLQKRIAEFEAKPKKSTRKNLTAM